jgi:hypothetical protein
VGGGTSVVGGGTSVVGGGTSVVGGGISVVGGGIGVLVLVGFGVLVGLGVGVIVGGGIGELVSVGGGRGELVWVGITIGVLEATGPEPCPCLGRFVLVIGTEVMVEVFVGWMDVAVGEKVIVLDASVADGLIVGVIKCCGNASSVSAAAVFTLAIAISIIF